MIQNIIDNLSTTFRSSGENVNEQIHESEETLLSLSCQEEFYPSLFQIISSDEIPNEIRKSALIYFLFLIKRWSDIESEEAKAFVIDNFPTLMEHSYQFLGICLKLTENLVDCTFYAGGSWSNLFDVIQTGFLSFENEKEKTFSSIILLNAISRHFKRRYDIEPFPIINDFYPYLRDFILFSLKYHSKENENEKSDFHFLPFVAICYQTITFLNSSHLSQYFSENIDDFNELLFQTTQIANFDKLNCTNEEFVYFAKQAIKFSAKMIQNHSDQINESIAIQLFQALFVFFSKFHNNELVLCSVARLIYSFLYYEPTYNYILENECSNFIVKLVFPFYYINSQDIEDSKNDPSQFLAKFQTQNYFHESESRAYLYQTLYGKTKDLCSKESHEFPQFCISIFQIFTKVIEKYLNQENPENQESENALVFSIFFLFSSINPSFPFLNYETFTQLMTLLSQLFESSSHLVISGVLFCIRSISSSFLLSCSSSNCLFPNEFYINITNLLISHPSHLVRYYAAKCFYEIIKQIFRSEYSSESKSESSEESQRKSILEECSKLLPEILKSYFELSSEFNDFEFIELLTDIMTYFNSSLVSDASQLICQVFELFINQQESLQSSNCNRYEGGNIIDSLFTFIKSIFERHPDISVQSVIDPLLECILQVLVSSTTFEAQTYNVIFEFIAKLSYISSFNFSNENGENKNDGIESIFPSVYAFQFEKRSGGTSFPPTFWKLYEIIPQVIENIEFQVLENGIYAMRSIFICNSEIGLSEEIMSFNFQLCEKYMNQFVSELSDNLFATMLFLSTIFVIAPPKSLSNVDEIFKNLIFELKEFFRHYETRIYSSILFISMLIQNSSIVFEILKVNSASLMDDEEEEDDENDFVVRFCLEWFDISDSFLDMFFILSFSQLFEKEAIYAFIQKTFIAFKRNFENFDFYDSEQKIDIFFSPSLEKKAPICSLILLDSYTILDKFTQFIQSFAVDYPEVQEKFNEIIQVRNSYLNDEDADMIFFNDDFEEDIE